MESEKLASRGHCYVVEVVSGALAAEEAVYSWGSSPVKWARGGTGVGDVALIVAGRMWVGVGFASAWRYGGLHWQQAGALGAIVQKFVSGV
jgi:hypothetical protein